MTRSSPAVAIHGKAEKSPPVKGRISNHSDVMTRDGRLRISISDMDGCGALSVIFTDRAGISRHVTLSWDAGGEQVRLDTSKMDVPKGKRAKVIR